MCGIAGIIGKTLTKKDVKFFSDLFWINVIRGEDSSGLLAVGPPAKKNVPYNWFKSTDPVYWFLEREETKEVLNSKSRAFIGHTRAATIGKIDADNAHPFDFENVVGVTNGTVPRDQIPNGFKFDTDAEAIYALINAKGKVEALRQIRTWDKAPLCLVFFDKTDWTLNLFRNRTNNDSRTLYFTILGNKFVFASEDDFIEKMAHLNRLSFDKKLVWQPKCGVLFTVDMNAAEPCKTLKSITIPNPPKTKVKKSKKDRYIGYMGGDKASREEASSNPTGGAYPFCDYEDWSSSSQTGDDSREDPDRVSTGSTSNKWPVIGSRHRGKGGTALEASWGDLEGDTFNGLSAEPGVERLAVHRLYNGDFVPDDVFHSLLGKGCVVCGNPFDYEEQHLAEKIGWYHQDHTGSHKPEPVCEECTQLPYVQDFLL